MMSLKWGTVLVFFAIVSTFIAVNGLEDNDYNDAYDYYEDDDDDNEDKCPTIDLPAALDGRCHISDSCSKITCEASVQNKHATIIFRVNRCDDPLSATVTIKSRGFSVDWSHTFKDDDEVKLPVDTGRMNAIGKVSVSLKVMLKKKEKKLHFKLELIGNAKVSFLPSLDRPFDATLLDGEIPLSSHNCGFRAWYNKQPKYVKILMIAGPILVFIFIFILAVCCCSWCKRRAPARLQVNLPSHRPQISSTKSRVPMQRLVNEA